MIHSMYCPTCHNHISTCKHLKLVACKEAKLASRKEKLEKEKHYGVAKPAINGSISVKSFNFLASIE